jgi:glycine/D-amino acid oxidase-like deaminating enzyme
MNVLICGGGVIGASTAYFLSRRGVGVTVVESTGLANAASGKSGGFLARDWCEGSPLAPLARRSFDLHAELAETIADDWGYRRMETFGGHAGFMPRQEGPARVGWLAEGVTIGQALGSTATTAQVVPAAFTRAMMRAAEANGAVLRTGRVTGVFDGGAEVDGERVAGDAVVIAMGPWSILAAQWMNVPPVFGLKGHSLVFDTGSDVPSEAIFLEVREKTGAQSSPEIFPRPDGTTYVCAISSETPLPVDPARVTPEPGAIERLEEMCRDLSPVLARAPILARQACCRPVTQDGLPLIGRVEGLDGAYIATGHSVWGILNAPATGEAMAELIVDGVAGTVDLSPFDPGRLEPLDPKRLFGG